MKGVNVSPAECKLLILWLFCANLVIPLTVDMRETTSTPEERQTVTPDGAGVFADISFDTQQLTEMAMLLSSIQTRPAVSQKVAPVVQDSNGVSRMKVHLEYAVLSVLGIDDFLQTVRTALYLNVSWMNPMLAWNVTEHSGIAGLELPSGSVWVPRLLLINCVEIVDLVETYGITLQVRSDGHVHSHIAFHSETKCSMDLTHFPYDSQSCPLIFVVISPAITWELEESSAAQDIQNLAGLSGTWTLEGIDKTYKMTDVSYPVVILHMKRKTAFYTVCLVLPMALTSYMNTMVFLIPPESGEKISFIVSVFVSTSVFSSFFIGVMPRGLEVIPNVMRLLVGVVLEGLLILLATILILRRFHQAESSASFRNDCSRVSPLVSKPVPESGVQDGCEEKQVEEKLEETARSRSFTLTFSLSVRQLDHVCFIAAATANTIFLCYLLIDSQ